MKYLCQQYILCQNGSCSISNVKGADESWILYIKGVRPQATINMQGGANIKKYKTKAKAKKLPPTYRSHRLQVRRAAAPSSVQSTPATGTSEGSFPASLSAIDHAQCHGVSLLQIMQS